MKLLLKYCGNHSYEDLFHSINSGANYIGVVFAESKRQVTPNELNEWLSKFTWPQDKKTSWTFCERGN